MDKLLIKADQVVRRNLKFVSVSSGVQYMDDRVVRPGDILILSRIAVENETSSYTQLRVGVLSGGVFYPFEEQKSPVVDTLYWLSEDIVIAAGENLRIELTGGASGDKINVYLSGVLNEKKEA